MVATPYDLSFRVDKDKATLCSRHLGAEDIKAFRTVSRWVLALADCSTLVFHVEASGLVALAWVTGI